MDQGKMWSVPAGPLMSTTWAWLCHVPTRNPCHMALYMKPPYFSSGSDGEFSHMDDSSAVLLGLMVKE